MSERDQDKLEALAKCEQDVLKTLRAMRQMRREILRRNRIRQAERIAPQVLEMRVDRFR